MTCTSGRGFSSGHGGKRLPSHRQALVLFLQYALLSAASTSAGARTFETGRALKATSATTTQQGVEYLSLPNARCMDPLIKNFWGSNAWDCKQRCTASSACGAWSLTKKSGKCELHTSCDKKQWDANYQSGEKVDPDTPNIEPPTYKKLPNTHCFDQLIQRVWETNVGQCRSKCTNNPLCMAFSHKASSYMCDLLKGCASTENSKKSYSEIKEEPAEESEASEVEDSESSSEPEGPWEGCDGQDTGFREKDDTGCFNPDDGFYAKASKNDVFGGVKYTGYWQSCKNLCGAAAQGSIDSDDLECGRGHYMTYNKDTGSCYFYRPPSAESNGCSQWRSKDSDRLGMYCGPEGGSDGDSSDLEEDKPPPSPSPPPTGDSSDSEEDKPPPSPSPSPPPTADSSDSSAEEEVDYNRKYSSWVGEYCSGKETIRTVKCVGDDKDCRELCASECDKEKDCEAFMTDYDSKCDLYSKCDVVVIDGCDDCTVQVCLENCPEDTKPYYMRRAYWQDCNSNNEIRSYDTECGSDCEDGDFEKVREDCADRCIKTRGCSDFFLPTDHSECELYTDCDLDYHDDGEGEGGYIGIFREDVNSGNDPDEGEKDSSDSAEKEDPDEEEKDSSDSVEDEQPDGPWNGCRDFEYMGWIEQDNVGCINDKDGYFHRAQKGDVYNDGGGNPEVTYDGTFQGCKNLCTASLYGDIDYKILNCDNSDYITYSESSGSCYFYNSPGGDHGCDKFRPKDSDRTAMRCGFT